MNISIVIPNYNGEKILNENVPFVIEALNEFSQGKKEVIIIDDFSKDNSWQVLSDLKVKYEKEIEFRIFRNEKNLGFAPTVNKGVEKASGDVVILLNTDVRPHKDFVNPLLSHFSDPEVFAVGCADENMEEGKIVLRGRGIGRWKRGFLIHKKGEPDKSNTLWVSGGSGAFRKSMWDKLDGLDPIYAPFYWEDIDLSYRGLKAGYKLVFEPKSLAVHEHEKGAIKKSYESKKITTIVYRNQFIFCWKNITDRSLILEHMIWLPLHFISALKRGDSPFILGFFKALGRLIPILISRQKAQKYAKLSDRDTIKEFVNK